ncbi:MAG: AbrB/MazE/SpoVT family DNA-binding domain-containing protein [Candidatus Thioglobus sp.]|nr:AbrB/MazE/SpoVT family DNA-binding domain-containing protein [Candidatus Thioglobus sp.]
MTEAVLDIKQWGNSLGMRLPAAVAKAAHLHLNQRIRLVVENNHIMVIPLEQEKDSLEDRLARFEPDRHSGEVMTTTEWVGAEKW